MPHIPKRQLLLINHKKFPQSSKAGIRWKIQHIQPSADRHAVLPIKLGVEGPWGTRFPPEKKNAATNLIQSKTRQRIRDEAMSPVDSKTFLKCSIHVPKIAAKSGNLKHPTTSPHGYSPSSENPTPDQSPLKAKSALPSEGPTPDEKLQKHFRIFTAPPSCKGLTGNVLSSIQTYTLTTSSQILILRPLQHVEVQQTLNEMTLKDFKSYERRSLTTKRTEKRWESSENDLEMGPFASLRRKRFRLRDLGIQRCDSH